MIRGFKEMEPDMKKNSIYIPLLIFIVFSVCLSLIEYGFYSIDEESYTYLTKTIVERRKFHFESDYSDTLSQLHRAHLSVVSKSKIYSVFPPGYPFFTVPFYIMFNLEGMQIANVFFTIFLVITFYFFTREFYSEKDAFSGSIILLISTQLLNYSVSLWSHNLAALSILLSFYFLFKGKHGWAGLLIGISVVVRYSGVVLLPILFVYLYKRNKRNVSTFLIFVFVGLSPLLFYNHVSFGSPFESGMSLLNTEEGYRSVTLDRIPKALVTNVVHYSFFPELELYYEDKGSLLETSPFLTFALLGFYLLWRDKKERRPEIYTIIASIFVFIIFISGTWSLGGLAHNARLLTDIVPLIAFLALAPIFYLKLDGLKLLIVSLMLPVIYYLAGISNPWLHFANLNISMISFIFIIFVILFRKDYATGISKNILSLLIVLSLSTSIFTALHFTNAESVNRRSVGEAAQTFEEAIPENSVVFIFGGEYATYTSKDYIFLDYRYAPGEVPALVEFYRKRPIYVLLKSEADKSVFNKFHLTPAGPIRTYKISTLE
jgi:hypothetical protein